MSHHHPLESIDWPTVGELVDGFLEVLHDGDMVDELVGEIVDAMIPGRLLLPGPAGEVLEAVDGPAAEAAFGGLRRLIRRAVRAIRVGRTRARARRAERRERVTVATHGQPEHRDVTIDGRRVGHAAEYGAADHATADE